MHLGNFFEIRKGVKNCEEIDLLIEYLQKAKRRGAKTFILDESNNRDWPYRRIVPVGMGDDPEINKGSGI